jgi:DNA-binding MarR family transcriptional regulator
MEKLTAVQGEVLKIIGRWFNANQYNKRGPSLGEIAKARGRFKRAVVVALRRLEDKLYIKRRWDGQGLEVLPIGKAWLEENLTPDG